MIQLLNNTYAMAEIKKNSQVFGSFKHSTNLTPQSAKEYGQDKKVQNALVEFEALILHTSLVDLDPLNCDDALLRS